MDKEFFNHYQIGCWFYRVTDEALGYDPVEAQKELGLTYFTTPEHWRDSGAYSGVENLEKYLQRARELNMPTLLVDRRFFCNRAWAKPNLEIARQKVKDMKERYSDVVKGFHISDEPWWGHTDGHKAIDECKEYVDMVRSENNEVFTFIALLGIPDRYKKGKGAIDDYINSVHPDFLLYNVYSHGMAEEHEKEQGLINFYYQLYMYSQASKEHKIPLWASPYCYAHWCFREPNKNELKWQLNVLAAHGVKGFVWFHLQEGAENPGTANSTLPIDYAGNKTYMFDWIKHENHVFMKSIASKLEGFELLDVFHYMFRQSNFKAWEFEDDDIIEDVRSQYHRHLIISKFRDDQGRYRIMVTNGAQNKNGQFSIKFKGEYAKYNVSSTAGYLCPGGAKVISLFDIPIDPKDEVLD